MAQVAFGEWVSGFDNQCPDCVGGMPGILSSTEANDVMRKEKKGSG